MALVAASLVTLVLGFDGLGPAKIGMTVREVEKRLALKLSGDEPPAGSNPRERSDFSACHYVSNERALPGIGFMVIEGKVARIDVSAGAYRTSKGAGMRTSEVELRRLYPGIDVMLHKYDPGGHYFRLESKNHRYGIVFETDGVKVTSFRSGELEPVSFVEGCS